MNNVETGPPLVFVYLGNPPPRYARDALTFASRGHDGRVVLLTDADHNIRSDRRYEVIRTNSWYDATQFSSFRKNAKLDPVFMQGFWFHVVERFFVLYQFMQRESLSRLFHAELDVMVFDLRGVAEACDRTGDGIFGVMDDASRALASLFYVNNLDDFAHFLQFALQDTHMRNEMEMIGRYIQRFPTRAHALPSNPYFENLGTGLAPSNVPDSIGLFDSNTFGHWLFGLDPKTIKYESKNHFRNEMVRFPIEKLRFHVGLFGRKLTVSLAGLPPRQLRTLHVHSKIVSRLKFRPILMFYLWASNFPWRVTITHRKGWWASRILDFIIGGRFWAFIRASAFRASRLSVVRIFLALAARGAVPMPNRQRVRLNDLLPEAPLGTHQSVPTDIILRVSDESEVLVTETVRQIEMQFPVGQIRLLSEEARIELEDVTSRFPNSVQRALMVGGEELLAKEIFLSSSPVLVIRPCAVGELGPNLLNREGVQLLQPSTAKNDPAARHAQHFFSGLGFTYELHFGDSLMLFQPELLREMFSDSLERVAEWAEIDSSTASPSLAFSYGTWLWNKSRNRAVLGRKMFSD